MVRTLSCIMSVRCGAVRGEDFQVDTDLVACFDGFQVASHPGLVGDDGGVFGIGFAVALVGGGCVVDDPAGYVEQRLAVSFEERDQEGTAAGAEVGCPD